MLCHCSVANVTQTKLQEEDFHGPKSTKKHTYEFSHTWTSKISDFFKIAIIDIIEDLYSFSTAWLGLK